jgi:Aldehyde dehydrogenase family
MDGRAAGPAWPRTLMSKPPAKKPATSPTPVTAEKSVTPELQEAPVDHQAADRVHQAAAQEAQVARPAPAAGRLEVRKTYKLFIGGAFPRSESGRSYPVATPGGGLLAYAARASRKDARDAVRAARGAVAGWSGATAYNRGQVLYRVAELMEGRFAQFAAEVAAAEGLSFLDVAAPPSAASDPAVARATVEDQGVGTAAAPDGGDAVPGMTAAGQVAAAIDRWVWYAGWTDKVAAVTGAANPVAGPYFNFSVPEPTGVVVILAPEDSSLLGLVSVLAPVIATGNTAVVVTSGTRPLPAVTLGEVLATSDVPAGVVNLLTGDPAELAPVLAAHQDVDAIDLTGAPPGSAAELEALAAGSLKRVFRGRGGSAGPGPDRPEHDWRLVPDTRRLLAFLEVKTVWHPAGI